MNYKVTMHFGRVEAQTRYIEREGRLDCESRRLCYNQDGILENTTEWALLSSLKNWSIVVKDQPELRDMLK